MAFIEIRGLSKVFGPKPISVLPMLEQGLDKEEVLRRTGHTVGLQGIDLDIERGETFVVMGLSGSGKSTLVRCLNRLIEPTSGELRLDGLDLLGLRPAALREVRRQRVSMVFQRFALLPHRTVLENVAFGLRVRGIGRAERRERAARWTEVVGLSGYESARPQALSGGMQQRVGLARALCTDPDVLLMDEAFSALDPLIRREMQDELIRLQRELGKTIVFITHDLDEALRLGDRIAILKGGRLVQVGTPAQIVSEPADDYVEAFVANVNRAQVLRVRDVMHQPLVVEAEAPTAQVAERLAEAQAQAAFVNDGEGRLLGVLPGYQAAAANGATIRSMLQPSAAELSGGTLLEDAMVALGDAPHPLPVLDDDGRLMGAVRPRDALRAMARRSTDGA